MKKRTTLKVLTLTAMVPAFFATAALGQDIPRQEKLEDVKITKLDLNEEKVIFDGAVKDEVRKSLEEDIASAVEETNKEIQNDVKEDIANAELPEPEFKITEDTEKEPSEEKPDDRKLASELDESENAEVKDEVVENEEEESKDEVVENEEAESKDEVVENEEAESKDEVVENEEEESKDEVVENKEEESKDEIVENKEAESKDEVVENKEEESKAIVSLRKEKDGLETVVCEQRDQISELETEIKNLSKQATAYMPIMDTMQQLMMMNMMMSQQQQPMSISYQPNMVDMMSQMLYPTMMMQSMTMGMNIASMNNLYHNYRAPAPQGPTYSYNIGGDYYGRDYSMTQQAAPQQPAAAQAPFNSPYAFNFGEREPSFGNVTPDKATKPEVKKDRSPSEAKPTNKVEEALKADEEMV